MTCLDLQEKMDAMGRKRPLAQTGGIDLQYAQRPSSRHP